MTGSSDDRGLQLGGLRVETPVVLAPMAGITNVAFRRLCREYGGGLFVPTVVLGELYAGAHHLANPAPLLQKIADLLNDVQVLDFDHACAEQFGKVRGGLLRQGISVPTTDLMIATVALVRNLTLVTNNTVDFQNIPALRLPTG